MQHAPLPGALQDAAAVYAHLVTHHLGARKGLDGKYHYPDFAISHRGHAHDLLSASNSETRLDSSAITPGIMFPPGETAHGHVETIQKYDDSRDFVEPIISGNDATPHVPTSPVRSTHANADPVAASHRPRIILIGDSAGGNLVLALARWIRDEGVLPAPDGMILLSPSCDPCMHPMITNRSVSELR